MKNSQESNLVEFVLDKVPSYELLNAPDLKQAEAKFMQQVVENLPELSQMDPISPEKSGHVVVYEYGGDHVFFVKEIPDIARAYEEKDE